MKQNNEDNNKQIEDLRKEIEKLKKQAKRQKWINLWLVWK